MTDLPHSGDHVFDNVSWPPYVTGIFVGLLQIPGTSSLQYYLYICVTSGLILTLATGLFFLRKMLGSSSAYTAVTNTTMYHLLGYVPACFACSRSFWLLLLSFHSLLSKCAAKRSATATFAKVLCRTWLGGGRYLHVSLACHDTFFCLPLFLFAHLIYIFTGFLC